MTRRSDHSVTILTPDDPPHKLADVVDIAARRALRHGVSTATPVNAPVRRMQRTMIEDGSPHSRMGGQSRDRCIITVLAGVQTGALFRFEGSEMVIGRGERADVRLFDDGLSRQHAKIIKIHGNYAICDLDSTNGTFVGGVKLHSPKPLKDGDRIGLGRRTILKFSLQDALEEAVAMRLYESTVRDPLTKAYNRRAFEERFEGEFAYAARHRTPLSSIIFDIDFFKKVNDTHGHQAGDEVLRSAAARVQAAIRTEDVFARYGGEEFVVLARGADLEQAAAFAERLRRLIEHRPVMIGDDTIWVTASFGVAAMDHEARYPSRESLFARADANLYEAKRQGRNRVVVK
ncbi:MAG: GGDEF domain-containing protein [Myxococcota bacterium]